ncbi:glucosamine-6-phosphate deaminase [Chitinophaga sp. XS-30]|uniref:glucosamine-6-phosphate deaminase n=1 Tax=Chitinophaga sp. XS-30 TaxID=2604421 RepID=UPI0011DCC406|nr:glucosamine-6-phosphate deaminase [Chitinophaga sp. XS-30]QEH41843.1 glucosamine-6-phosphate deaminase [Chitinophaga sp. XS-30]
MRTFKKDSLDVQVYEDRQTMGREAAALVAGRIRELLAAQPEVNIIFAAAPSQNEFLATLAETVLDWGRVNAFHMDEYIGLDPSAPQLFGAFLDRAIFGKVPFRAVHYINGNAPDIAAECRRYRALLEQHPADIACMGIGENGHLAFNDPPVADFNDRYLVKTVGLEEACRAQQVNDGCFAHISDVPAYAITLTIPALMAAKYIYCMVPGPTKAKAIKDTLTAEISEKVPSTALRRHKQAVLFIDAKSGSLL